MGENKVNRDTWKQCAGRLLNRRKSGKSDNIYTPKNVLDSESHFNKCKLGNSVLEVGVGCGDFRVKKYCKGEYHCIDAYPVHKGIQKAEIETFDNGCKYETIVAFSVLDSVYNLDRAIANMKNLCSHNIILLTGLNIPPDEFHTFQLSQSLLSDLMGKKPNPFLCTYIEELFKNVFLIEYTRSG